MTDPNEEEKEGGKKPHMRSWEDLPLVFFSFLDIVQREVVLLFDLVLNERMFLLVHVLHVPNKKILI